MRKLYTADRREYILKSGIKEVSYRIIALFICLAVIAALTSCGEKSSSGKRWRPKGRISSESVAEAGSYSLFWDDEAGCVVMRDEAGSVYLSDILYSEYKNGNITANTGSSITVSIIDTSTLTIDTLRSYSEIEENGKIYSEKIDGGIRVTYSFNSYSIAVPVDYVLRGDSLLISVDGAAVIEGGDKYKLLSVSVAPYMCHTANTDTRESYLFVPSGSGALMYPYENADGARKYSGEVYGADASRRTATDYVNAAAVRLPVFGVKNGDSAVFGIIEQGAGAAVIEAQAGYARSGYSNIYPTFWLRGYDVFRFGSYATGNNITTRVSDDIADCEFSVAYYLLSGEAADYNGMAALYRRYLSEKGQLEKSNVNDSPYSITISGGTQVYSSFIGFPIKKLEAMTTFKQAADIIEEMKSDNEIAPAVRLTAFSDKGIMNGEIAGGKNFKSVYGGKKDYASLMKTADNIYTDFEIIRYSESGNGFSYRNDAAKTAIHYFATQYEHTPLRLFDETKEYRILSRGLLSKAAEKAIKKADSYGASGIAFSSLGEFAYSDYSKPEYAVKYGMEEQAAELLKKAGESRKTAVSGGNYYAACAADTVFDAPVGSGDYNSLDAEIPFYQMVFHSYKPLYSEPVNCSDNPDRTVMLAASGGTGLGFAVINRYLTESSEISDRKLYAMVYSDNKDNITGLLRNSGYAELYAAVKDSAIKEYVIVDENISKTVFENGVEVYANHSGVDCLSDIGTIKAYSYKAERGEKQ